MVWFGGVVSKSYGNWSQNWSELGFSQNLVWLVVWLGGVVWWGGLVVWFGGVV